MMNQSLDLHLERQSGCQFATTNRPPQRVASNELLRGDRRLIIEHGESVYTLLLTRNGKLILTK